MSRYCDICGAAYPKDERDRRIAELGAEVADLQTQLAIAAQYSEGDIARAEAAEALLDEVAGLPSHAAGCYASDCMVVSDDKLSAILAKRNGSVKPRETEA